MDRSLVAAVVMLLELELVVLVVVLLLLELVVLLLRAAGEGGPRWSANLMMAGGARRMSPPDSEMTQGKRDQRCVVNVKA